MKLILKLLLLIACLGCYNQIRANDNYYKALDSAEYVVSYMLTFKIDTLDLDKIYSEEMLLFVGKEKSLFISHNKYRSTSMNSDYNHNINLKGSTIVLDERRGDVFSSKFNYRIYKNLPQGKLSYIDFIPMNHYKYEEPLNNMEWEIKDDRMRILGYSVQKAVTNYGGRTWEAWFTPDIPINDGPYKFAGLPGLILKINDIENHYVFLINKFGKQNNPIPILIGDEKYIQMTREEYHDFEKKITGDLYQQLLQMGITVDDPEPLKRGSKAHNNFLERNYNN